MLCHVPVYILINFILNNCMKLIWYIFAILAILSILFHNPQRSNLGNFSNDTRLLNPTRSSQKELQLLIATSVSIFFLLTIFLAVNSTIYY